MPGVRESATVLAVRVLALVLAIALVPLAASPPAALDRPTWTPGDSWTYATNTTLTPGLNLTGSVVSTFQGVLPATPTGPTVPAYRIVVSGSGTAAGAVTTSAGAVPVAGTWILTGEQRLETVGLQPVYNLLDLSVNGTYSIGLPYSARVQNTTTFQVLSDDWTYPLDPGASGRVTAAYNFTQDSSFAGPVSGSLHDAGTGEWTVDFSIGPPTSVHTPAGTFTAYPVTETWPDGSRELSYAAPLAGNAVATQTYGPDGNLTAVTTLTSYRYQALETPAFLGLTLVQWSVVAAAVAAALVAGFVLRRRRRKARPKPEDTPDSNLTSGPRGP